jgi:carboxylesterase type B
MFGDRTWQSSRRLLFEQARAHNLTQTWTYQMDVRLPTYPPALGACHSVDLTYSFGDAQLAYTNATSERAEWARSFNLTKEHAALSRTAVDYW